MRPLRVSLFPVDDAIAGTTAGAPLTTYPPAKATTPAPAAAAVAPPPSTTHPRRNAGLGDTRRLSFPPFLLYYVRHRPGLRGRRRRPRPALVLLPRARPRISGGDERGVVLPHVHEQQVHVLVERSDQAGAGAPDAAATAAATAVATTTAATTAMTQ